jgi:hypothetical protein
MSIPTSTKTIQNDQLLEFPGMTVNNAKTYLVPLQATPKGRTKRPRVSIRSTTKQQHEREKSEEKPMVKHLQFQWKDMSYRSKKR